MIICSVTSVLELFHSFWCTKNKAITINFDLDDYVSENITAFYSIFKPSIIYWMCIWHFIFLHFEKKCLEKKCYAVMCMFFNLLLFIRSQKVGFLQARKVGFQYTPCLARSSSRRIVLPPFHAWPRQWVQACSLWHTPKEALAICWLPGTGSRAHTIRRVTSRKPNWSPWIDPPIQVLCHPSRRTKWLPLRNRECTDWMHHKVLLSYQIRQGLGCQVCAHFKNHGVL
jgi:hypothetical protein